MSSHTSRPTGYPAEEFGEEYFKNLLERFLNSSGAKDYIDPANPEAPPRELDMADAVNVRQFYVAIYGATSHKYTELFRVETVMPVLNAIRSGEYEAGDLARRAVKYLEALNGAIEYVKKATHFESSSGEKVRNYVRAMEAHAHALSSIDAARFNLSNAGIQDLRFLNTKLDSSHGGSRKPISLKLLREGVSLPIHNAVRENGDIIRKFDAPAQVPDYVEEVVAKEVHEDHAKWLPHLIKFGLEAGPGYAATISKLIHVAENGSNFGGESSQESDRLYEGKRNNYVRDFSVEDKMLCGDLSCAREEWPPNVTAEVYSSEMLAQVMAKFKTHHAMSTMSVLHSAIPEMVDFLGLAYMRERGAKSHGTRGDFEEKFGRKLAVSVQEVMASCAFHDFREDEDAAMAQIFRNGMHALLKGVSDFLETNFGVEISKEWDVLRRRCEEKGYQFVSFNVSLTDALSFFIKGRREGQFDVSKRPEGLEKSRLSRHLFTELASGISEISSMPEHEQTRFLEDLRACISNISDVFELYGIFNKLIAAAPTVATGEILSCLYNLVRKKPQLITLRNTSLNATWNQNELAQHRKLFDFLFQDTTHLAAAPELVNLLLGHLKKPDYRTFYTACCIAGDLLAKESTADFFADSLAKSCFSSGKDFSNPDRIAILRNITERIPPAAAQRFLRRVATCLPSLEALDINKLTLMLGEKCGNMFFPIADEVLAARTPAAGGVKLSKQEREAAEIEKAHNGVKLLGGTDADSLPKEHRDIVALINDIVAHRTIQIGKDERRVSLNGHVTSPLAEVFKEIRVKRRAVPSGQIPKPDSLACNIALMAEGEVTLYAQLDGDGGLALRIVKQNGLELATIYRNVCGNYGIPERVFDEVHFLILEALGLIYKKKDFKPAADEGKKIEPTSGLPPSGEPDSPTIEAYIPLAGEREERPMRIDLTDKSKRMHYERAKRERIVIGSNRDKVKRLFQFVIDGRQPREDFSSEDFDVELFRVEAVGARGGSKVFTKIENIETLYQEIATSQNPQGLLGNIFIRKTRAHSKAVPYRKSYHAFMDEGSGKQHGLYSVSRGKRSDLAKLKYGEYVGGGGESLDLGEFDGFMWFEVPDNPHTRKLHARMKDPLYMANLLTSRQDEIMRDLFDREAEAKKRIGEQNEVGRLFGDSEHDPVQNISYMREETAAELEGAAELIWGTQERVDEESFWVEDPSVSGGKSLKTVLRLPAGGYEFNHTFNQGQFESLEEFLGEVA